jgi:hypothetical protein
MYMVRSWSGGGAPSLPVRTRPETPARSDIPGYSAT